MLPGFRFLFAATFLTMSILVFGLGAAALLRAAHEQFATNPSWHAAPEATFAQQAEPARPVLAMLRVGVATPAAEQKAPGNLPGADVPAPPAPAEQAATVAPVAGPDTTAALKPEQPAPENPAAAAPGDAPASDPTKAATPASGGEAQIALGDVGPKDVASTAIASTDRAAAEPVSPPANAAVPAVPGVDATSAPATAAALPEADPASIKTAALDNPFVTVETTPPGKSIGVKLDPSAAKKQLRARRAAHRRRMAARAARLARLAALLQQQQMAADPFGLRFAQPAAVAAVRVPAEHSGLRVSQSQNR